MNDSRHKTRYIDKRRREKKEKNRQDKQQQISISLKYFFSFSLFNKIYENLHLTSRTHTVEYRPFNKKKNKTNERKKINN